MTRPHEPPGRDPHALIRAVASAVRSAIDRIPNEKRPVTFKNFSRGSCGDTALVLGTYLAVDCKIPGFQYVSGERGSVSAGTWTTHAWLERDGLVVDITADQFSDECRSVIVETNSLLHSSFRDIQRMKSNYFEWTGDFTAVSRVYALVKNDIGEAWKAW